MQQIAWIMQQIAWIMKHSVYVAQWDENVLCLCKSLQFLSLIVQYADQWDKAGSTVHRFTS